ncbi:Beta-ribofuranosylaminobenzene 5'-phosphate synthase [uncultured archaeon]|nr:Beta-ribofuranosylaminobenzene 5'-phosphate synthase [uncultured archaeon]
MKIRGGDLDLVEYEFQPFFPGESIYALGFEKDYRLTPSAGKVRAVAPGRIHLTVLDMNRFAPNRPGGGGVGFALKIYCSAEVECTDSEVSIDYSREPIVRHFVEVFRKTVRYNGGFKIKIRDHEKKHVGLGSTGSVLLALGHAMNAAVGSPLKSEQIRLLLGHNYVEETEDGRVTRGFETGVGPAAATYGGMVITGDELALVYRHSFAEGKNAFITIPPTVVSSAGRTEFDLLMNRARNLDYQDRELKAYLMLMDLIPALEKGDLKRIGDTIWEIEFRGSKRAEVEHHGFEIYRHMSLLREAGLEFVGMSSVGPSIAIVTDKSREEVERVIESLGLEIAIETKVDNEGLKIFFEVGGLLK